MKGETKPARIDQKSTFFYFFDFFLKIQDIRESKTSIFERGYHKKFWGQVLTIFQTDPAILLSFHRVSVRLLFLSVTTSEAPLSSFSISFIGRKGASST